MGNHVATTPSQVAHPWRAMFRTIVQVGIVLFTFVLAAGPAIPNILAKDVGAHLPRASPHGSSPLPQTGAVARIMAPPRQGTAQPDPARRQPNRVGAP